MAAPKYNLFEILGKLNKKDYDVYSSGTPELQKQLQPFVLMRWMTGTNDAAQIIAINEFVNPYVFSLYQHKELHMQLLAAVAPGHFAKYQWIKGTASGNSKPLTLKMLYECYHYSPRQAQDSLALLSGEAALSIAEGLGWQESELAALGKEWDIAVKVTKGGGKKTAKPAVEVTEETEENDPLSNLLEF